MSAAWEDDPVFGDLSDAIASDRLIVFTGAGISNGLLRVDGKGIPGWQDLLKEITGRLVLLPEDAGDIAGLLAGKPSGVELIEAASILEGADKETFERLVRKMLTPAPIQTPETEKVQKERHRAILDMEPRGIITLNIDGRHHKALASHPGNWLTLNPTQPGSESRMLQWIRDPAAQPFLLEAHGSLESDSKIVFSHEAYRELMEKNPVYRAFLGNLFVNYRFLFAGFGLTDLDFDYFVKNMALTYGLPPQPHIVVRKKEDAPRCASQDTDARERWVRQSIHFKRRFGIKSLDVPDYSDVWTALRKASEHCGPGLEKALADCISPNHAERNAGHAHLARLGQAGKAVAVSVLGQRIADGFAKGAPLHDQCEYLYSLKYLASVRRPDRRAIAKEILFRVLETMDNTELVAHAISALESYLSLSDLDRLEAAAQRLCRIPLMVPPGHPDEDGRCPVYLEAAILRLRAAHMHFPPRPGGPLVATLPAAEDGKP